MDCIYLLGFKKEKGNTTRKMDTDNGRPTLLIKKWIDVNKGVVYRIRLQTMEFPRCAFYNNNGYIWN